MTYAAMSETFRAPEFRSRAEMCVREQGFVFTADGRPDIAVTAPGAGDLLDDGPLLAQVQAVWPTVAAARYPSGQEST